MVSRRVGRAPGEPHQQIQLVGLAQGSTHPTLGQTSFDTQTPVAFRSILGNKWVGLPLTRSAVTRSSSPSGRATMSPRLDQDRRDPDGLGQVHQDDLRPFQVGLGERERLGRVDVLVRRRRPTWFQIRWSATLYWNVPISPSDSATSSPQVEPGQPGGGGDRSRSLRACRRSTWRTSSGSGCTRLPSLSARPEL